MSDALRRMHEAWLGMVQPIEGLVFSSTVLADKGVGRPDETPAQLQKRFLTLCPPSAIVDGEDARPRIADLSIFLEEMLGLTPDLFDAGDALPAALSLEVPEADQLLRPTLALKKQFEFEIPEGTEVTEAAKAGAAYEMLLWDLGEHDAAGLDLDAPEAVTGDWRYPPTAKFERLLRHVRVPLGLLTNREEIRLVYAPHGESTGHLTFRLMDMAKVDGRPILDAFVSLLSAHRFFGGLEDATPRALLEESRKRQANVDHRGERRPTLTFRTGGRETKLLSPVGIEFVAHDEARFERSPRDDHPAHLELAGQGVRVCGETLAGPPRCHQRLEMGNGSSACPNGFRLLDPRTRSDEGQRLEAPLLPELASPSDLSLRVAIDVEQVEGERRMIPEGAEVGDFVGAERVRVEEQGREGNAKDLRHRTCLRERGSGFPLLPFRNALGTASQLHSPSQLRRAHPRPLACGPEGLRLDMRFGSHRHAAPRTSKV